MGAAALALGSLLVGASVTHPQRASATSPQVVISGDDYATKTFSDPWDYSNPSDLLLDNHGPAMNLSNQFLGSGVAGFTISRGSYVSPLWAGYPGSLRLGRDGARAVNQLNANYYTRVHLRGYATAYVSAALQWFTCGSPTSTCEGGMPFGLSQGYFDIDMRIANNSRLHPGGKAWYGRMMGIRLAMTPHTTTNVRLDFLRIYRPNDQSTLYWASPNQYSAKLWWSASSTFSPSADYTRGIVPNAVSSGEWNPQYTNVSGYPPNTKFFAVASDGTRTQVGQTAQLPLPIIDNPGLGGCSDYATRALGYTWNFASPRRIAGYGNAGRISFTVSGRMAATNWAPQRNNPWIRVPLGRTGIDGRKWHRLTIVESYSGPFNLKNSAGGGTMARVMWTATGHTVWSQTNDIVTYSGKRTIFIDMAMSQAALTEPEGSAAQRYAFASSKRVTRLRFDPNEDPGYRHWHVYSMRLGADCSTNGVFVINWHDNGFVPGSVATVYAVSSTGTYQLATLAEKATGNVYGVRASRLPVGTYTMRVVVRAPDTGVAFGASSPSPLKIYR